MTGEAASTCTLHQHRWPLFACTMHVQVGQAYAPGRLVWRAALMISVLSWGDRLSRNVVEFRRSATLACNPLLRGILLLE